MYVKTLSLFLSITLRSSFPVVLILCFAKVWSSVYRYEQGNSSSLMATVNKEEIKKQLRRLLNVIDKMNDYLQGDEELALKPAAVRNLDLFSLYYYNKMLII